MDIPCALAPGDAVLALDLGSATGFALRVDGVVHGGVMRFEANRHEGAGMPFLHFRAWLGTTHHRVALKLVAYEAVARHVGTHAAHVYGGFWATLTAWCQAEHVPFVGVPVGTIKKEATGKGNADKQAMLAAAAAKLGVACATDDEADARWLLRYVERTILGREEAVG